MALSKSLPKGQIPIGCQLCETDNKIHWRCIDCTLLICNTCKKVHLKLSKDHKIVDVKSLKLPTSYCQLCETSTSTQWRCNQCDMFICETCKKVHLKLSKDHEIINIEEIRQSKEVTVGEESKIVFKVVKHFIVDQRNIHYIAICPNGSLWLGGNNPNYLQHIKLSDNRMTVLSTFDIEPLSLAISPSGSTFVKVRGESTVKIINEKNGQLIDTNFTVHPLILTCIHVTRENNIILGGIKVGEGCVIMMDQNGKELVRYENDQDKPILTYPRWIGTTRNGNIFIADGIPGNNKGRVVRIKQEDRDIMFYKGHSDSNFDDKPFYPVSILVTTRDNVLIRNSITDYLHIRNNEGDFIACYNLSDIGITRLPYSLALSSSGNIYVGSVSDINDPQDYRATLYEIEFSGI